MKGYVTINTDASYHYGFHIGAFAFWIVSDYGRITQCGALKNKITNANKKGPTEAEVQCIVNAFHVLKAASWTGIEKIIVNTDSKNAISIFENNKGEIKKWKLGWGGVYRGKVNTLKPTNCKIEFRHIKAHKSTETAKSFVNDWCDKKAKEMLWNKINETK